MTKFTLIIPYNNTAAHDRTQMMNDLEDSIPERGDLEVIWIDDHSETSWRPAHQHDHTRHRCACSDEGQRYAGMARNKGLDMACGTYILFADSDDLLDRDELDRILDAIPDHPDHDLTLFRVGAFRDDGKTPTRHLYIERTHNRIRETLDPDDLTLYPSPVGKIIRRAFIKENNLRFSGDRYGNDVMFGMHLALAGPSINARDERAYLIREGNDSLTQAKSAQAVSERFQRSREVQDLMKNSGRNDLVRPMLHLLLKYARHEPLVVLRETSISLIRGNKIMPDFSVLKQGLTRRIRNHIK